MNKNNLGDKAKLSVLWNTGFNFFRDLLQFFVMLILVRLISPESYGKFALLSSIMTFIHVFSFNTFIQHILQLRDESRVNYHLHFSFGIIIQISVFLVTNLCAFVIRFTENYKDISLFLHILSLVFFLELFSELYRIKLQRELDWKRMRILHGIGILLGSVLSIVIAYNGGGIYALIIPGFISNLPFIFELLVINKWKPNLTWNYIEYKQCVSFSFNRILSGLSTHLKPLVENSLISSLLSFTQLGFFNRAIGISTILIQKFTLQFIFAIYPVLTKVQPGTSQFRKISTLILNFSVWLIFPLVLMLILFKENFVVILYGEQWLSVTTYLTPISILMGLSAIKHIIYSLILSSNFEKVCSVFDITSLAFNILMIFIILKNYGIIYYLYAQIFLLFISVLFLSFFSIKKNIFHLSSLISSYLPPLVSIIMPVCLILLKSHFLFLNMPILDLITNTFILVFTYIFSLRFLFKQRLILIINYLPLKNQILRLLLIN